jgi:hypothetical protein
MSDEDYIARAPEQNTAAPEALREIIVHDYTVVPQMIAALQWIHDAAIPKRRKDLLTVLAVLPVASLGGWPDPRAAQQVLSLLRPQDAKNWRHIMGGMVAAAVAWLRAAKVDVVVWLNGLIETNQPPFVLGFDGPDAMRWYYEVKETLEGKRHRVGQCAIDVFRLMAPDPSLEVTEHEAKRRAFEILNSLRRLNPTPLHEKPAA